MKKNWVYPKNGEAIAGWNEYITAILADRCNISKEKRWEMIKKMNLMENKK